MAVFISELLKTLLLAVIYIVTGYLILFFRGSFRSSPINFRVIFLSFFAGIISVVCIYSMWLTHCRSVLMILLPLVIVLAFFIRKRGSLFNENAYSPYFASATSLIFFFFFFGYMYLSSSNDYHTNDYILYSKISYYMPKTSCENDYHLYNTLDGDYCKPTPYHYLDLWMNSVNAAIVPINSYYDTFILITPALLAFVIFLAFMAIYETHRKPDVFGLALSFFILFFAGIFLPLYHKVSVLNSFEYCFFPFTTFHIVKFAPTVLFLAAAYVLLTNVGLLPALLTFGMLGIVSAVNLPAGAFALVITFIYFKFYGKGRKIDFSLKLLSIAFLPFICVGLFYTLLGNHEVVRGGLSGSELIHQIFNISNPTFLKHLINITLSCLVSISVIYLAFIPIVIYFLYKRGKQESHVVLYIFILLGYCVGGIISWGLLSGTTNSVQSFYFTLKPLPLIVFIVIILLDKPWLKYTMFSVICICGCVNICEAIEYNQKNDSKKTSSMQYDFAAKHMTVNSLTVSIKDSSDYTNVFTYQSTCFGLGRYISVYNDSFFPISISDYNLPFIKDPATRAINMEGNKMGIFYRFVEKQKKDGSFVSVDQSQIDFIKKYRIRNIILSAKANLPASLLPYTDSTMAVVPGNGEKIVRLKY